MSIDILFHCSSCGADIHNNTLEENLKLMENCTNCLADLKLKGRWTGTGHRIMTQLVKTHGIDKVKYANEKLKFERI